MNLLFKLFAYFYNRHLDKLDAQIGCRLEFETFPKNYINGIVKGSMTGIWKKFGLDIVAGCNHWTVGHIVDGISTRFDHRAPEFQSWFGAYTVRLAAEKMLTLEDHFKLAVADQNSWLRHYGDPDPSTSSQGWQPKEVGAIKLGQYSATLYEFGCTTHSDIGQHTKDLRFRIASSVWPMLFKVSNPNLSLKAAAFMPKFSGKLGSYEAIDLRGYIAIFDIKPGVKAVLYANGAIVNNGFQKIDTFELLKEDFLKAMKEIRVTA